MEQKIIDQIKKIYRKYPSGGALHIVLDDGNTESHFVQWCIENIDDMVDDELIKEKDKQLFIDCANNLLKITERQRNKVITKAFKEIY